MSSFSHEPAFSHESGLPIIDLSLFDAGDSWRDHLAAQIDRACSAFGFFYVAGHDIDTGLSDTLLDLSRKFFAQDESVKRRIEMSLAGRAWRGYFPIGTERASGQADIQEGIYFGSELEEDDARVRAGTPLHGSNLFPELPGFRDVVLDYMRALTGLGHRLTALIARGLGLGDSYFVDRYTGNPTVLFRIFNYPALERTHGGARTDHGLLKILKQDSPGLQMKSGGRWIDVPDVPGAFVCNVGDMLEHLTNGRYVSAQHKVGDTSGRDHIAMPFFFDPSFDAVLAPIRHIRPEQRARALNRNPELREVTGTYGDYLISKVSKGFPDPGRRHFG